MKLPSVSLVASATSGVARRFPVVFAYALLATTAGIFLVEHPGTEEAWVRLLVAATLGLPLATALTVFREKRGWGRVAGVVLHAGGLAAVGAVYAAWPHWQDPVAVRRYIQFSLGFHLLAAFLPFLDRGELNGFWQYNRALFLRFLLSALYAAVLYGGLAVAILALDKLFGLDVKGERYGELWVVIAFLFTTGFFLGGVPGDLKRLDAVTDYPRGLRIFSQFILLPLVTVYLVILTLYMGKIVITRVWPSGWIGYLVSSVAAVGILLLLLVFPVQERAENRWVRTFSRWFYVILIPSIVMLLLAIMKRIGQYGLTENRYFMVVLAVWLAAVALYFILSRGKSIKVIPASLCVLAFLTAFGPWGAYRMSARSQTERLRGLLVQHGVLVDGRIRKATGSVSFEDRQQITAALTYLMKTHGRNSVAGWFEDGLAWADTVGGAGMTERARTGLATRRIMEAMDLAYADPRMPAGMDRRIFSRPAATTPKSVPISGYDYAFTLENLKAASVVVDGESYDLTYEMETASLRLERGDEVLVRIPLQEAIDASFLPGPRPPDAPSEPLTIRAENDRVSVLLLLQSLYGNTTERGSEVSGLSGVFFVRFAAE